MSLDAVAIARAAGLLGAARTEHHAVDALPEACRPEDEDDGYRIQDALEIIDISNNLGDTKSIVTHPSTTTHQRLPEEERLHLGISDGLLRLSVGLEDVEDIKEDLARALSA